MAVLDSCEDALSWRWGEYLASWLLGSLNTLARNLHMYMMSALCIRHMYIFLYFEGWLMSYLKHWATLEAYNQYIQDMSRSWTLIRFMNITSVRTVDVPPVLALSIVAVLSMLSFVKAVNSNLFSIFRMTLIASWIDDCCGTVMMNLCLVSLYWYSQHQPEQKIPYSTTRQRFGIQIRLPCWRWTTTGPCSCAPEA